MTRDQARHLKGTRLAKPDDEVARCARGKADGRPAIMVIMMRVTRSHQLCMRLDFRFRAKH